jgi:hypothetical protein
MTATPIHPKVQAATAAGALATVVVAILAAAGITVAPAIVAAIVVLVTFAAGYIKRGPEVLAVAAADAAAVKPVAVAVAPVVADEVKKVQGS